MNVAPASYVASVCSAEPELIDQFMRSVLGGDGKPGKATLRGMIDICIEPVLPQNLAEASSLERLRDADICVVLIRHLDHASVERLRDIVRRFPAEAAQDMHVAICRNVGETEYKISCTKCNQNLIVRDALAYLRVKCPHCREVFEVPGQTDVIRNKLLLNASQVVRKVFIGNQASCREALEIMVGQITRQAPSVKSTTMRIDLPNV